jgi:hypothetical protein
MGSLQRVKRIFSLLASTSVLLLLLSACSELGSWDRLRGNLLLLELEKYYSTRLALTIDGNGLTELLEDFPVLVVLNNARTSSYASLDPGHIDFVYVDELNTAFELDYEIERWGPESAEEISYIWVRIPEIVPGGPTTFWLYYNATTQGQPENPAGVWRDGYELVYHFAAGGDAGAGDFVSDSTAYGRDGIIRSNSPTAVSPPAGMIGLGFRLEDANRTYIDTGYQEDLAAWTLEAWVKGNSPPGTTGSAEIFTGPIIGGERYNIVWDHMDPACRGTLFNIQGVKQLKASFGTPINADTPYYLAGTYALKGKTDLISSYTDGALEDEVLVKKPPLDPVTSPLYLGCSDSSQQVLNGIIDEVRISSVTRSREYILYQYMSMQDSLLIYVPPEPL